MRTCTYLVYAPCVPVHTSCMREVNLVRDGVYCYMLYHYMLYIAVQCEQDLRPSSPE